MNIPYGFEAELEDGSKISSGYGSKPVMIDENASQREVEQAILERLEQDYSFVTNVRWHKLSDWNM